MAQGRKQVLEHAMRLKAVILEGNFAVMDNRTWDELVKKKKKRNNRTVGIKEWKMLKMHHISKFSNNK